MKLEPACKTWSFTRSEAAAGAVIKEVVGLITKGSGIAENATFPYELCLREMISNAIQHGATICAKEMLSLTVKITHSTIQFSLCDNRSNFTFHDALKREVLTQEHGRGYTILRNYGSAIQLSPDGTTLDLILPIYIKLATDQPATAINQTSMKTILQDKRLSLSIEKDLTAETVPELRQAMRHELSKEIEEVYLDLEAVGIVDSTGIGLIIALNNSLKKKNSTLQINNASPDIEHLFRSMCLDKQFSINSVTA